MEVVHSAAAGAGLIETGPDALKQTTSLGEIIAASPDKPVHILFVHGIRAGDRGTSDIFRANLRARLQRVLADPSAPGNRQTHHLDIGPLPELTYMGQPVWPNREAWAMGPFVDRYEYPRKDGMAPIIVDEVNWWPLALPLRCQALLQPEVLLAGPDMDDLRWWAALDKHGQPLNDGIHYPFISKHELHELGRTRPPGGGAACANGYVKRALMDWGLSDAVIALGPMQTYLHKAIEEAFDFAGVRHNHEGKAVQFVVVSESLGSFIVLDAYGHGRQKVQEVLDDTAYIYFFANQLALLELGRLTEPRAPGTPPPAGRLSLHRALLRWAAQGAQTGPRQIIAFSDPSDALTFRVPPIPGVTVVNVYDRNGLDILHLAADPVTAHTGHSSNPHVLDLMMRRGRHRPSGAASS